MYKIKFFLLPLLTTLIILGCNEYDETRVDFSNTVDPYVYVGQTDKTILFEDDTAAYLYVYLTIPVGEDVTISYNTQNISTTNDDYNVQGDGAVIIKFDPLSQTLDNAAIIIKPVDDNIVDNPTNETTDEEFILELTYAETESGKFLEIGDTVSDESFFVSIKDNDCIGNITGTYTSSILNNDKYTKDIEIIQIDTNHFEFYDITAGFFDNWNDENEPNVPIVSECRYYCGYLRFDDMEGLYDIFNIYNISGEMNPSDSSLTVSWSFQDIRSGYAGSNTTKFSPKN